MEMKIYIAAQRFYRRGLLKIVQCTNLVILDFCNFVMLMFQMQSIDVFYINERIKWNKFVHFCQNESLKR
ncbi:Protein of unknown function [Gryllus bimaculatus]|nr:Protein of unknown function [Gryllus bimaculatus]